MNHSEKENEHLLSEIRQLRERLAETEEVLEAIRHGRVEALVATGPQGDRIYTLKGADQSYRVMIETMNEGAAVLSEGGTLLYCNRRFAEMLDLAIETIIGGSITDLVDPADRSRFDSLQERAFLKETIKAEVRLRSTHQTAIPVLVSMRHFNIEELDAVCLVVTDLTELKQTENVLEAVRKNEERFREAFEHAPVGMSLNELDGRFIYVNDAYCRIVGYPPEELIGSVQRFQELNHPDDKAYEIRELNYLLKGKIPAFDIEKRYIRRDGKTIWVRASTTLRKDDAGNPMQIVGLVEDITPRKEAEEQLRQAQKMEAIGRLAGGVAHEFNNMLNVIIGYAEILSSRLEVKSDLNKYAREIQEAARRSAEMTGQLLAYSRKQMVQPKVIDMNAVIENQKTLLNRLIGEAIKIRFLPGDAIWPIRIDPSQIDQILANLAVNAQDAIPGTGQVTIMTKNKRIEPPNALPDLPPGDYVRLTFSDTGIGMEKKIVERVFEPYFTTKDVGKGTGLGLSTVYGIVKQNKGAIYVNSKPGRGTTFTLFFPRSRGEPESRESQAEQAATTGRETVLVVEDETQVLNLAEMILKDAGYRVLKARTPAKAIEIAQKNQGKIDLLLTDVIMPEMNGKALQALIEEIQPDIRTLLMSGYTDEVIDRQALRGRSAELIRKPFTPRSLAGRIRGILDRG